MAERKAVNKYYPPDWDPRKGSVNKRVGQHPLRDRARKLSQGILVIRFELPYNIWCGGCGSHVGMGVRYNAEKSKVGNYYTTPIYKFRMKCHLCDNYFEIQTDPKNHDYVILSGARRKEQRWDPVANEQIVPEDKATQKKMAMDAMYKLEHGSDDRVKGKEKVKNLSELESSRYSMKDDYLLNRMARDKFRAEKKQLKEAADADKSILDRGALDIELLDESEEDRNLAGLLKYSVTSSYEDKQKEKRKSIEKRPLFERPKPSSSDDPSSSSTQSSDSQKATEETKQKLSENLRLAQKDPFSIGKPVKLFNLSTPKPSCLGIRLKSSKVMKRNVKKSNNLKKSLLSHIKAHSSSNSTKSSNNLKCSSLLSGGMTESNLKISNIVSNKKCFSSTEDSLTAKLNSTVLPVTSGISKHFSPELSVSSPGQQDSSNRVEVAIEHAGVPLSTNNNSISSPTNSLSTSGLSMLMSSYDEDKDSDDSSSS